MKTLSNVFEATLNTENIHAKQENTGFYKLGFSGEQATFDSFANIDDEQNTIVFHTILPIKFTESQISAILDTAARINAKLSIGNFDVLLDNGLILFRTGLMLANEDINEETIKHVIYINWMMSNKFFSAFASVVFSNCNPKQAITSVLKNPQKSVKSETSPIQFSLRRGNLN